MANLKEIRTRINSIKSTMQITNAMKMVSASKLKRAQEAITRMLPYANKINELIQKLSTSSDGESHSPYTVKRPVENILLVAITSNRGLCGGFNSNVVKEIYKQQERFRDKKVSLVTVGKKGGDILAKTNKINFRETSIFDDLSFQNTEHIAQRLMDMYVGRAYDKIILIYNHFINAANQSTQVEQFLPVRSMEDEDLCSNGILTDYIFEPSEIEIIETLMPKALKIQFFKALRDSFAAEHAARMTAMHKATDNANELKDQLTLMYNKARQASITSEILEIVGGAEALNN